MNNRTGISPHRQRPAFWLLLGLMALVLFLFLSAQRSVRQPRPAVVLKKVVLLITLTIRGG
jgi:hypothetical protein